MIAEIEQLVMRLREESGALRRGHFLLSSGLHSTAYVQCALLLEDPVRARKVGQDLAELLRSCHPDSVVSPALGFWCSRTFPRGFHLKCFTALVT